MLAERLGNVGNYPEILNPEIKENLLRVERKALKGFFGKDIDVPEPPSKLFHTLESFSNLGARPELHYAPQYFFTKVDKQLPGWMVKPDPWFFKQIKKGTISNDAATLQEGWYIILDPTGKPDYEKNGRQRYKNDYLEFVMRDLRRKGTVGEYRSVPERSRFGTTFEEIEQVILTKVVNITRIGGELRNKKYIEFNFWGNTFHPEWGQTNTLEWFADPFFHRWPVVHPSQRLFGGFSALGGLGNVQYGWPNQRSDRVAFGYVVRFPSKLR